MDVGNKIFGLRKKNNLSQEQLAEKIGVARQTISKWELGETSPDLKQAKELSKIFKVSLDELVDNDMKDLVIEKVSNTERLAGVILNILKLFGMFIILMIILYFVLIINRELNEEKADTEANIVCTLYDEEYSYGFEYNETSGQIYIAGGDSYIANVTGIEKYSDAYQAIDIIDAYVKSNNGTCEVTVVKKK